MKLGGGVKWGPLESKGVCVWGGGELSDKPKKSRLASSLAEGRRILGGRTPPLDPPLTVTVEILRSFRTCEAARNCASFEWKRLG